MKDDKYLNSNSVETGTGSILNDEVASQNNNSGKASFNNIGVTPPKKKNFKKLIICILVIFIVAAIVVGRYYSLQYSKKSSPTVRNIVKEEEKQPEKQPTIEYVNQLPDYRSQYNNQDIEGQIEIPGLDINALVVRSSDNSYYLDYNLYKQYDQIGVPFFDYRNLDLNNNRQINIYGHNTENSNIYDKLPFVNLESYTDKEKFDTYKDIYLSIDERKIHYEVIAVKILTDGNNEHMKLNFNSDDDFVEHAKKMMDGSLYMRDGEEVTTKDKLLVLQICHFNPKDSYLLIFGKEVS